jgi:MoxR-like ATPase
MADYRTLSVEELLALPLTPSKPGELNRRQAIRELYPQTRGAFGAQISLECSQRIIEAIPQGSVDAVIQQEIDAWKQAMGVTTQDAVAPVATATGVAAASGSSPVVTGTTNASPATPTTAGEDLANAASPAPAVVLTADDGKHIGFIDNMLKMLGKSAEADSLQRLLAKARSLADEKALLATQVNDLQELAAVKVEQAQVVAGGKVKFAGGEWPLVTKPDEDLAGGDMRPHLDPMYDFSMWRAERTCGGLKFKQTADDVLHALVEGSRIMLVGPPSVGKTTLIEQFAARTGWPCYRINLDRDMTRGDFLGERVAKNGSTPFEPGLIVQAAETGGIVILDELDHAPSEVTSSIHPILEHGGRITLTTDGGRVVVPKPTFRIVAAMNTQGFGDESGRHPNAQVQDAALLSRFDVVFFVSWPAPAKEAGLLVKKTGVAKAMADLIVKIAADTRKAADKLEIMYPITIRQTLAWCRQLVREIGRGTSADVAMGNAFCLAVLNAVPGTDAAPIAEIAQRHLGQKLGAEKVTAADASA